MPGGAGIVLPWWCMRAVQTYPKYMRFTCRCHVSALCVQHIDAETTVPSTGLTIQPVVTCECECSVSALTVKMPLFGSESARCTGADMVHVHYSLLPC